MPVRFRCSYCNQLLGISRRKIGVTIKCPTCQGQVLVPPHDSDERPQERIEQVPMEPPSMPASARDFDGLELDLMLQPPVKSAPPAPALRAGLPGHVGTALDVEIDVERLPGMPPSTRGLVLTPMSMTLLVVAVIIGLALAFAGGLLVGKSIGSTKPPPAASGQE